MKRYLSLLIFIWIAVIQNLFAGEFVDQITNNPEDVYIVRLKNGDLISGKIMEVVHDLEEGDGFTIGTQLGTATIFENQIAEMHLKSAYDRSDHRVFLLPTAKPIGSNHFVGAFELLFLYGGFGVSDFLSVTLGRSVIPGVPGYHQLSVANIKLTAYTFSIESVNADISLAAGGNLAFVNDKNRVGNVYGVATYSGERTSVTAGVFTKISGSDFYIVNAGENVFDLRYANGSFGVAFGVDSKFSSKRDLHFIGEIWNSDVNNPSKSGVLAGFRLGNEQFSADFGFAFFTQPLFAPFTSFCWTPF